MTTDDPQDTPLARASLDCTNSKRADGRHSWLFDGDDPYVICAFCNEVRDARTDRVIQPAGPRPPLGREYL